MVFRGPFQPQIFLNFNPELLSSRLPEILFKERPQAPKHLVGNPQLLPYRTFPIFSSEPSTFSEALAPDPH